VGNSGSKKTRADIEKILKHRKIDGVDLAILHPPYADIIKFTDKKEDLSNSGSVNKFVLNF
jgi:diketogulonate reductase-like aldo/keto reductase